MDEKHPSKLENHWLMEAYRRGEEAEKILNLCRAELEESPLSLDKRSIKGCILKELGRVEEARRELVHVERLIGTGCPAFRLLADMEKAEGKLQDAARSYLKALVFDSDNEGCWSSLRQINAAMADALRLVFDILEQIQNKAVATQESFLYPLRQVKEAPGADHREMKKQRLEEVIAILEGWLATIQRIKSMEPTGA